MTSPSSPAPRRFRPTRQGQPGPFPIRIPSEPLVLKPRVVTQVQSKTIPSQMILALHLAMLEGQKLGTLYPYINAQVVAEAFREGVALGSALRINTMKR
jgi:hypothetical protein